MSVIVGIVCETGIVMASDSQTTFTSPGGDAIHSLDTRKINVVEFEGAVVLVAETGETTLSGRAVEIFNDLASGKTLSDYRTAADIAENAIRKLRERLREQNLGCSADELHEYILKNNLDFALMIAHYHDSKPYIFTIKFSLGIAAKTNQSYLSIGVGGGIAGYILSWFNIGTKTPFQHGMIAALYAVEEVKKLDPYCAGKTKLAIIAPKMIIPPNPDFKTASEAAKMMLDTGYEEYIAAIAKIDAKAKSEWATRMNLILEEGNKAILENAKRIKAKKAIP